MDLLQTLQSERTRYLDFFISARKQKTQSMPDLTSELLVSVNDELIEEPFRYMRIDLISKKLDGGFNIFQLSNDKQENLESISVQLFGCRIQIFPFTWDEVNFQINHDISNYSFYKEWIIKWLDLTSERENCKNDISNAIHKATPIKIENNICDFSIDFGTAPVEAFVELINELSKHGVKDIIIR